MPSESGDTAGGGQAESSKVGNTSNVQSVRTGLIQTGMDRYLNYKRVRSPSADSTGSVKKANLQRRGIASMTPTSTRQKMPQTDNNTGAMNSHSCKFPVSNRFEILSKYENNDNSANDGAEQVSSNNAETTKVASKPPPIYIRNQSMENMLTLAKSIITNRNFTATNVRRGLINEIKIQTMLVDDYRLLVGRLDKDQIMYYTYRIKSERGLVVVIKGLEVGMNCDEIREALNDKGFQVQNIFNIRNRDKIPQPLYKVELKPSVIPLKKGAVHPIYNLNRLLYRVVKIEEPHKHNGPAQCRNCQEFEHTKRYCLLPPVCVICAGPHTTANCPEDKKNSKAKKCGNCGLNHTANYRGCEVYINHLLPKRVVRQAPGYPKQSAFPSNTVQSGQTYADAARSQAKPVPPPQTQETTNNMENTVNNLMQMMMQFMASMQSTIQELVRNQNILIASIKNSR